MKVLITGAAGFIGFHTSAKLCALGHTVIGIDSINDYYDPQLKRDRLQQLATNTSFTFKQMDIANEPALDKLFADEQFTHVINLAAQAGVRYSIKNPKAYIHSNIVGFANLLEACRHNAIQHFVYASSSSVYGLNTKMPFSVQDNVDHPISLYAASKKSNELMAHSYSHLYGLPTTGLRFFTVYGPWGRPDMALYIFTKAILNDEPIPVFNEGNLQRDFTYIDDIVEGVVRITSHAAESNPHWNAMEPDPSSSPAPYKIYNIGNNNAVSLKYFIEVLENCLGKKAKLNLLPMQPGDVHATYANIDALTNAVGFAPNTPLEKGIQKFVAWYKNYHSNK